MDDLWFRKTVYAEPFTKDPAVIKAAAADPKKQAFWDEIRAMEAQLHAAMTVPVPENLAEKLILRQTLKAHSNRKQKRPWYLALAASVVLAAVLTVNVLTTNKSTLAKDVFAHLSHLELEVMMSENINTLQINDKLASFNGQVNGSMGDVVSANYCYLDKVKSLHLVIRGEHGLTSLFVMPDSITESLSATFNDAKFQGASFILNSAKIVIVGENRDDVATLQSRARSTMTFSA